MPTKRSPRKTMTAPTAASHARRMGAMNRWREQYNPARGLTLARALTLIESYARGEFSDLMWTYGAPMTGIENADADLLALIERRTSALLEMDWEIKIVAEDDAPEFDEKLAEDQRASLRAAYEGIDNLYEAIEHLAMATFRGFAHCELWRNADGDTTHLEPVDQWNILRDGLRGEWKYNPDARSMTFRALPDDLLIDPRNFIIREVRRPVNRIALVKFIRANLSDKDWDAFIEIYGVPSGVVIMPPNVPPEKEAEYEQGGAKIAEGGSGALPHGSDYKPNDGPRGVNPFRDRLQYLTEKLILAGTGGLLTMLTESGSGTLAGNAHAETFAKIARGEARKIGELFQRQIDGPIFDVQFPGKPRLAYFELCFNAETDAGDVVDHAAKLAQAGYQIDADQLSEKTGYTLTLKAPPVPNDPARLPGKENDPNQPVLTNRAQDIAENYLDYGARFMGAAADIFREIDRLASDGSLSAEQLFAQVERVADRVPEVLTEDLIEPLAQELEKRLSAAVIEGARAGVRKQLEAKAA